MQLCVLGGGAVMLKCVFGVRDVGRDRPAYISNHYISNVCNGLEECFCTSNKAVFG